MGCYLELDSLPCHCLFPNTKNVLILLVNGEDSDEDHLLNGRQDLIALKIRTLQGAGWAAVGGGDSLKTPPQGVEAAMLAHLSQSLLSVVLEK